MASCGDSEIVGRVGIVVGIAVRVEVEKVVGMIGKGSWRTCCLYCLVAWLCWRTL